MNLKQLLFHSRDTLKDLGVKVYPEVALVRAANEGKNELCKIIRQAREDYFLTTATGTISSTATGNPSQVTLPSDFLELKAIEITSSGFEEAAFIHMDRADPRFHQALVDGDSGGNAFYYDIVGLGTLEIGPGSAVDLGYKLLYIPSLADMALPLDTPTGIPTEHHDYIVTWMVCEGLRREGDSRIEVYQGKLDYQRGSIIESVNERQIREPSFVMGYMEDYG